MKQYEAKSVKFVRDKLIGAA